MAELKSFDSLMIVHAEDSHAIDRAPHPGGDQYATLLASRPRGAENKAIAEVIERARWTGARAHILHLSSSDALPMIASAKRDGVHLTVFATAPGPSGGRPHRRPFQPPSGLVSTPAAARPDSHVPVHLAMRPRYVRGWPCA